MANLITPIICVTFCSSTRNVWNVSIPVIALIMIDNITVDVAPMQENHRKDILYKTKTSSLKTKQNDTDSLGQNSNA